MPVLLLCMAYTAVGKTIYVDTSATGVSNGTSWANAYKLLQNALAAAAKGDEIWVAAGTYLPDRGVGIRAGNRDVAFKLKSGVAIYGGFQSGGGQWQNRNPSVYLSILSGDLNRDDSLGPSNKGENSYHVVDVSGTDATAVLDGFVVTGGNCNGDMGDWYDRGAGIFNYGGEVTVRNCTFKENSAFTYGGAIVNHWSNMKLTNCTFVGNSAGWRGGAVANISSSSPTLTNCTFEGNTAGRGGAIWNYTSSSPALVNCTFSDNSASNAGGGLASNNNSNPTVINCIFSRNSATTGGAVWNYDHSNPMFANCVFNRNSANTGGAMWNYDHSNPVLTNCTFSNNSAEERGGAFWNYYSSPTIANCILWDNRPEEIYVYDGFYGYDSLPTVTYSNVLGGWTGEGNIAADPLFVDAAGDDLRLLSDSPCVDAANNTAVPRDIVDLDGDGDRDELLPLDVSGNVRFFDFVNVPDTGKGLAPIVNMGAYESPTPGFLLSSSSVIVPEAGTATFEVALLLDPRGTVEVMVTYVSGDGDIVIESGELLIFDSSNYSVSQTVTLSAAKDRDYVNGTATISVSAATFVTGRVTATEQDGDAPAVLYVDAYATGANDGLSWTDAFVSLQDALRTAPMVPSVTEIRVAEGTYKPDQGTTVTPGDRTATFQLPKGVKIKGGYAGLGAFDPDARDIRVYKTILSGDLNGDDGPNFANNTENSYHVVTSNLTTAAAGLYGFIITGGNADGASAAKQDSGGGMYNLRGSPTLINCVLTQNTAKSWGGGMLNYEACNPMLINCVFSDNTAGYGGGMACYYSSSPTLVNCLLSHNAANYGGGMANYNGSNAKLTNCTISGNLAGTSGGGMMVYDSAPTVTSCIFWGNTPKAIYLQTASVSVTYSDVRGGWVGTGNINADPLFIDAANGDYHLLRASPCFDAGSNMAVPPDITDLDGDGDIAERLPFDLDGNPRFIDALHTPDTGLGTPPIVDMGAYEFPYFNLAPVADAGQNRMVSVRIDGTAELTLDGSNSYDEDDDELTYKWSWVIGEQLYTAEGVNPTIQLSVGVHTIQLIVSDGVYDSQPDQVVMTVEEAMQTQLAIYPSQIRRYGRVPGILAQMHIPQGVTAEQIDGTRPLVLNPGEIEGTRPSLAHYRRLGAMPRSDRIAAFFDKKLLMAAIPDNGSVEVKVVGRLKSGESFYGTAILVILP
jgi:hypothetical protein